MKSIIILFLLIFGGAVLYPTIPNTQIRDYSRPVLITEGNEIYQAIPGTYIRDYGKPGYMIEDYRLKIPRQQPDCQPIGPGLKTDYILIPSQ